LLKSSDDIKQTYDGKTASLTFTEVFPDDSGRYECVAVNSAGEKRTACKVTVEGMNHVDILVCYLLSQVAFDLHMTNVTCPFFVFVHSSTNNVICRG